ncbi:hypothetical protein M9978_16885 [Sphingomonas sp. MG17]|uniref:Uncharacterized protein n=1 Tax=Sphingomonas tagetis TaxID=2949092 RepID=A0A9X2KMS0_9SPHN|nr:hypothetical protein [Sphingomonas tagetis]MCP3732100.1 hypothetical protein [Sphingomonas tagetis]
MVIDKRDINILFDWLDLDGLLSRPQFPQRDRQVVDVVVELTAQIGKAEFATHLSASDLARQCRDCRRCSR